MNLVNKSKDISYETKCNVIFVLTALVNFKNETEATLVSVRRHCVLNHDATDKFRKARVNYRARVTLIYFRCGEHVEHVEERTQWY